MKATVEWLKEFVTTEAPAQEIGATLTMLGLELEHTDESSLGPVLHFKVTPNRGDCLSVLGIARELCAKDVHKFAPTYLFSEAVKGFGQAAQIVNTSDVVTIEDSHLCRRYAAMLFDECPTGPSSEKLQRRLLACGMRPISIVVDTTNYVMLELGQPLHAFDRDKLEGGRIVVRRARAGDKIKTLDGIERKLQEETLMICDSEKPVAIAGLMGGEQAEVSASTKALLLESAHFDPVSIRRARRALGMNTEASYRFERYVDPGGVVRALLRFAALIEEQTGLKPAMPVIDVYPKPPTSLPSHVRQSKWNALLGTEVPMAAAAVILKSLGCDVKEDKERLIVTPPSWRQDLLLEEDYIEEIGRVWGYEKIPEKLPGGATQQGGESMDAAFRTKLHTAMLRLGFSEVVNHTLTQPSRLDAPGDLLRLRNPAAPELAHLRNSLLPGLAASAAKNRGRDLFLFEIGRVFRQESESRSLAFLMSGKLLPEHWKAKETPTAEFFDVKGVAESLFILIGRRFITSSNSDGRFHSSKQAALRGEDGSALGVFGEVSSDIAQELDLPLGTLVCELDINATFALPAEGRIYQALNPYPAVRRDLAFVIDKSVAYQEIESAAKGELVEHVRIFDVYEGKGIPQGKHSLAISMILRHPKRTLTDEEANEAQERALRALEGLGAQRR